MNPKPYHAPDGFDWVTHVVGWEHDSQSINLNLGTATEQRANMRLSAFAPDVWRITFQPPGTSLTKTPIVTAEADADVALQLTETQDSLTLSGARLTLEIDCDPWSFRLLDANGTDILRENPADIDGLGRPFVLPLGFVAGANGITQVSESFHLRQDEHLYGLGEKFTALDKVGQRIVTWTQDAFGSTSERSHKNIPFLISTRGWGLLIDSGARITWDLGVTSCQSFTVMLDGDALDAYVISGDTPAAILERYRWLTGAAPVPPKWTFGLWVSSGGTYRTRDAIDTLVQGLETHDVPASVIHVDPWWLEWRKYCDFQWNETAFPDMDGFIADLHQRGLRLCLWEHPYISVESDAYAYGEQRGYFLKRPDGEIYVIDYGLSLAPRPDGIVRVATPETSWNARVAIVDFTHPDAYTWFQDLHRPLLQRGVDVFKTDFGEDIPADAVFFNGQTGATMHNLYPLLYNKCVVEVTEQERGYSVVWARAATAGSQRYPIHWSADPAADFDSLACTIRSGLSIGFSGIPFWSNDIGGYRGMPSPRLYVRWAQFGLFCSHSRMHGDSPREPWVFGEEATAIVRRYVKLRYQLIPYLYSAAHDAARTGLPVIRALALEFPDDPGSYHEDLEFMLGSALLVAPIYDAGERRRVYLPPGQWLNYWTKTWQQGSTYLWVDAPLDTLPLFVRAGAILPLSGDGDPTADAPLDPLTIEVYPAPQMTEPMGYRFDEDDGTTEFSSARDGNQFTFGWQGNVTRAYHVRVVGLDAVSEVWLQTPEGDRRRVDNWQITADKMLEIRVERTTDAHLIIELADPTPAG